MAKGVGLDAGEYEVKVVELDGSYKKPRLTKVSIDKVARSEASVTEERHAMMEAESALHALKDARVSRDNVTLGFPCREAVLRDLTVPFTGVDAIRKVIKFEAEGAIHSHNVDDMVVDFRVTEELDTTTRVMVAAVPKRGLGALLDALASMSIEPESVDLDTMALYRVADWAGCFTDSEPGDEPGDAEPSAAVVPATHALADRSRRARIVVDVGARSTRILAVVDSKLVDMRALRVGVDTINDEIAARAGIGLDEAREAVSRALDSGEDFILEFGEQVADDAEPEPEPEPEPVDGDEELPVAAGRSEVIAVDEVLAARDRFMTRLRRELMRFLAGLQQVSGVDRLYVTGGGTLLSGMSELLGEAFACEPRRLDVLGNLSHNLDDDEVEWIGPRIAVAVGLGLGPMGGPAGFNFRQEELAFRRRFDRIKFPLAIACMLAVFLPFIYGMRLYKRYDRLSMEYGKLHEVQESDSGRRGQVAINPVFWGYVGALTHKASDRSVGKLMGAKDFQTLQRDLVEADTFQRLPLIRDRLQKHVRQQQEETGVYENLQLPSGYWLLSYFSDIIKRLEPELGSFLITEIELNLPMNTTRHVTFTIAIRGESYRPRFDRLKQAFEEEFTKPESPFKGFGKSRPEDVFRGELEGTFNEVKLEIKEDWI